MAWQGLKLNLRVSQKQILTPGLVQMVSVLALNRLELREMINQEMIANPLLEEQNEEPTQTDNYSDETFLKAETEKVPEKARNHPFDEFDVGSFFNQYLDSGGDGVNRRNAKFPSARPSKVSLLAERPFRSSRMAAQRDHLFGHCKRIAENIIGTSMRTDISRRPTKICCRTENICRTIWTMRWPSSRISTPSESARGICANACCCN